MKAGKKFEVPADKGTPSERTRYMDADLWHRVKDNIRHMGHLEHNDGKVVNFLLDDIAYHKFVDEAMGIR